MNVLPEALLNKIHNFSNTNEIVNNLLLDKTTNLILTSNLNRKWTVDFIRIKLIFKLWYKKFRPVRRHSPDTRFYTNSWTRPTYEPSDRVILLR